MTKTQEDIVHEDIEVEEEEDSENLNPNLGQRKGKIKETLYIAQKQQLDQESRVSHRSSSFTFKLGNPRQGSSEAKDTYLAKMPSELNLRPASAAKLKSNSLTPNRLADRMS